MNAVQIGTDLYHVSCAPKELEDDGRKTIEASEGDECIECGGDFEESDTPDTVDHTDDNNDDEED